MTGNIDLEAAFDRVFKGFYEEVLKNRAADAEQMARDNAVNSAKSPSGGGGDNDDDKKVVVTSRMEAEKEKTRAMSERTGWADLTADARKGIRGVAFLDEEKMGVKLAHTVEYGVYLELANDGKHAILRPVLNQLAPEIKAAAIDAFRRR
jgi:hypothetical protein